ncbi:MAG: hypothetical protein U1F77_15440 [Kiritimatiellia bacterium]
MTPIFPPFDLARFLRTVFVPVEGCKVCILIDLADPADMKDFAFLKKPGHPVQKKAHEVFYQGLRNEVMQQLGLTGGEMFAYQTTGGSNLDLPATCVDAAGNVLNLEEAVCQVYNLILCISDYSATAPLTALAKKHGFRGSTMHGLNDVIVASGLSVDYNEVSRQAEKLRLGMTRADAAEIDYVLGGRAMTLRLELGRQEAQKSHGLCHGTKPDIANLPAGEVYFVPTGAEGTFPIQHEDGTITINQVKGGRIVASEFHSGNAATADHHRAKVVNDPVTGVIGELGFGTQVLPFANADIQDEKVLGTVHVATGRSDHLGGHLTPDLFKEAKNASHDDLLFHPVKTPSIALPQVRLHRDGQVHVVIENYKPAKYLLGLLAT